MDARAKGSGHVRLVLRLGFLVLMTVGFFSAEGRPQVDGRVRPAGGVVALVGATVIDGTGAEPRAGCTVLIEGERIRAVGEDVELPAQAEIVDVSGHTIVPGLIDVHGHLYANVGGRIASQLRPFARLYLAGGVTSVFSPGDYEPRATLAFRDAQRAGEEIGTRIYSAGPYFNHLAGSVGWMEGVANAEQAREMLRTWGERIDGVKVYADITPEEFDAVVADAHALGLRVTGHLGSLTAGQAIDRGIDRLEHGIFAMSEFGRPDPALAFDLEFMRKMGAIDFESGAGAALIEKIIANEVVLDPTIVIFEAVYDGPLELAPDWERYLAPQAVRAHARMNDALATLRPDDVESWEALVARALDKQRELVRRVHEGGGWVVGGTDPVALEVLPGYGLQREAAHFVAAGMSELEAIRACTLAAARALGLEQDLGSVAAGKLADLVVLDGDPTEDIGHLARTKIVYQAGARFSPEELRESVVGTIR